MLRTRFTFVAVIISLISIPLHAQEIESPLANSAETKVLEHYIGEWEVEITSAASTDEVNLGGTATAKWIAGGRYVQQSVKIRVLPEAPMVEMDNIMGWNPDEASYTVWSFSSHEPPKRFNAKWDAEKKTMTSVTEVAPDITATTTADFSESKTEKWKVVISHKEQGKLAEVTGVSKKK